MIETQLGGKYSKEDQGLFHLKSALTKAGIYVRFPMGNDIVVEHNGIALTFDPQAEGVSFYEAEVRYLRAIKNNSFHIIHNKYRQDLGYIGQSASVEMAYTMLHNKPLVLLYPPNFSDKAPQIVQEVVAANTSELNIARLDTMQPYEISEYLQDIARQQPHYDIDVRQEITIMKTLEELLESYKSFR